MRIAIVSDAVYPYHKGGKERRFFEITTRMAQSGHDVHVYCMKWWKSVETVRLENGVHLHGICPYMPLYSGKRRSIRQGILFGVSCLLLYREEWDVIEVDHMPYFPLYFTKIVCLLKGKRMFATWNEVWGRKYWISYMGVTGIISWIIERVSTLLPDRFIAISKHTADRLTSISAVPESKIDIVPPGIDIEKIRSLPHARNHFDVIFAGRLLSHKNVPLLVKAISKYNRLHGNISCLIIGNGPERKRIMTLAQSLDVSGCITFKEFLPNHDDLFSYMKSSRMLVLPSLREGFGMVVIEARACGIPAIVLDNPDNAAVDLISDKNGKRIHNNETELANAIYEYMTHAPQRENLSSSAEEYSWDAIVKSLEAVYLR